MTAGLDITNNAREAINLTASGKINDQIGGDVFELVKLIIKDETDAIANIKLEDGAVVGEVVVDESGTIVEKINTKTETLNNEMANILILITNFMMNDLRKRMGDVRRFDATSGAWARVNGGEFSGQGIDGDMSMVQVGVDTQMGSTMPRVGVAFSYGEKGQFADVIARVAKLDTDLTNAGYKANFDNMAYSLSGELGWTFNVTPNFFIEPAAELTYTHMNSEAFDMAGANYTLDSSDSLIGRIGLTVGVTGEKVQDYVRVAGVHEFMNEFMGDTTFTSSTSTVSRQIEADGKDSLFELGLGGNVYLNDQTFVWVDVERTQGATLDEDWRVNVGVRYNF